MRLYRTGARALNAFGNFLATSQTESGYQAARWTRLTAEWSIWRRSADQEILGDLGALRARSRNLVLNNPFAKRFVSQVMQNVAGPHGFRFKPRVRSAAGVLDKATNAELARAWGEWTRRDNCTVDGKLSWRAVQRLVMSATPQDGEVLIRMVEGFDNPFGFALQLIDADLLDEQYNEQRGPHGNEIRMGVEIDRWGRPLGYWLWTTHPSEVARERKRDFIPAAELLHLYVPFRVGQTRGVPWTHAIMMDLKQADGYAEAELIAARIAAAKMGFFTTREGAEGGWTPPQENAEGAERLQMEAEPGLLSELPPWLDFKPWDPQHPNTAYRDFMKAVLHSVASGIDVCYHNLTGDLEGVNYSSARVGELDERDSWRALQQWLCEELHQRVYERWLGMAMLTGQANLPSYRVADYRSVAWLPRGWAWVDPQNELNAIKEAIALGLTSRTIEAAAQGRDPEEIFADLEAEAQLAKEYGIEIAGTKTAAPTPRGGAGAEDDDELEDDDVKKKEKSRSYLVPEMHITVPASPAPQVTVEVQSAVPAVHVAPAAAEVRIDNIVNPTPVHVSPQVTVQPAVPMVRVDTPVRKKKITLHTARGDVVGEIEES